MEASRNPYTPGAGTKPPTLAGRDALLETAKLALERIATGVTRRASSQSACAALGKQSSSIRCRNLRTGSDSNMFISKRSMKSDSRTH